MSLRTNAKWCHWLLVNSNVLLMKLFWILDEFVIFTDIIVASLFREIPKTSLSLFALDNVIISFSIAKELGW